MGDTNSVRDESVPGSVTPPSPAPGPVDGKRRNKPTTDHASLEAAIEKLDRINARIVDMDPVLKERAADILMRTAFPDLPGITSPAHVPPSMVHASPNHPSHGSAPHTDSSTTLDSLVELWKPETQLDWALLAGYYVNRVLGKESFTGQEINTMLKQLGYGMRNITRPVDELVNTKPQLVLQMRKTGTSKQARKYFRVTAQGAEVVLKHLKEGGSGASG
jgi:hypothetical protein